MKTAMILLAVLALAACGKRGPISPPGCPARRINFRNGLTFAQKPTSSIFKSGSK